MVKKLLAIIFFVIFFILLADVWLPVVSFLSRGILYAPYKYEFEENTNLYGEYMSPDDILNKMVKGTLPVRDLSFSSSPGFGFETNISMYILVNKQYEKLHITELVCEYEGKSTVLGSDDTISFKKNKLIQIENKSWYTCWLWNVFRYNLYKFFKGKKAGNVFEAALTVRYSFDSEPEKTETIVYDVTVYRQWEHWAFWGPMIVR
jgi:hypothetical protein